MARMSFFVFFLAIVYTFPFPHPSVGHQVIGIPAIHSYSLYKALRDSYRQLERDRQKLVKRADRALGEVTGFIKDLGEAIPGMGDYFFNEILPNRYQVHPIHSE